ncbi:MAG: DUF4419 domain-containing protein [Bacteroidaceae bacterium]|nr:DUF4419 domain-containing protein [Bacteroidaceae bacterium]
MKKSVIIIILTLIASLATAQTNQKLTAQTFSMKDLEELRIVNVVEGLQGPTTGLDIVSKGSITFVVDENLPPIDNSNPMEKFMKSGTRTLRGIFRDEGIPGETHAMIAQSFSDNEKFYTFTGKDVFFQTVVRAYAEHRPLVFSPDMIWVLISQGFARYVNAHPEEMRDQIVSHTGKMDLVVKSDKDLLSEDADWEKLMSDFCAQIGEYTKADIAQTITADFSTTGITERITSQITLMETVKSYFDYVVHYIACGIPTITLNGTPEDWLKVLEKTKQLEKFSGVEHWVQSLVPILTEFIKASEGKPNQAFWQRMVKKNNPAKLAGGGCDFRQPTELDGWILKFFPDENAQTLDQVPHTHKMPSERVYVDFKYQVISPADGKILVETPLQLIAGFIGTEVDTVTHALTPKMGWVVRQMEDNEKMLEKLKKIDQENDFFGIELRVNKVPEILAKLPHIKRLTLNFTDEVEIPEWFYDLKIDNLKIEGEMSDNQAAAIRKHFQNADIRRLRKIQSDPNNPLIIVDGVVFKGKLSDIDPATIKSQRVLKDAVATAVYGSQGVNGVIEITTNKSASGKNSKKAKAVKPDDKISGTVSDDMGPLMGAVICEIDVNGRILESAITDNNGQFTMKIKNPQDSLRFSYVGTKTVFQAIDKKEYKIKLQQVSNLQDMRMRMRQSGPSTLPIPVKEISMKELKELGIEIDEEGVSNEHNPRIQINLSDEEQTLVMSVNDLGFNMFRKVGAKESILLSPLGMTYALGLINNGATGMTRTQINKVLGCDNVDAVNIFCRKMLTESPRLDKLTNMEITNEFCSPKSYKLKPAFKEEAIDKYDTQFKDMESDHLTFTLVNTIDFKGIWTDKFLKANTEDELFKGKDGKETMVPMMNQTRQFFYTENDLCQALCMPYSNGAYQMIVLLPKDGKTIQEVAQSLTADSWEKMYDQMREVNVDVKLPRFESESEVNLTGMMSALMPNAFSMKKADFSNLFDIESCIRMIMQKGHIKVDETGAEATVATILQGRITGLDLALPQTTLFHATHPFLYFIREWSTGTIFFIGQYMGT